MTSIDLTLYSAANAQIGAFADTARHLIAQEVLVYRHGTSEDRT